MREKGEREREGEGKGEKEDCQSRGETKPLGFELR